MLNAYWNDKPQINESWLIPNRIGLLLIIRTCLLILTSVIWWFQSYAYEEWNFHYLAQNWMYLTIVGLNMLAFYLFLTVLQMSYHRFIAPISQKNAHDTSRTCSSLFTLWHLTHFVFHIGFTSSLTIILLFWLGYANGELTQDEMDDSWIMMNSIFQHGVVFIFYYIEFALNSISFKWGHLPIVVITLLLYLVANLIVALTYEPVYPIMTWDTVMSYATVLLGTLVTIAHFAFARYLCEKFKGDQVQQSKEILGENNQEDNHLPHKNIQEQQLIACKINENNQLKGLVQVNQHDNIEMNQIKDISMNQHS